MKLSKSKRSLPGALAVSLALWIALLPFISAIHMALVPHVYSTEHRHFHEVVTSGQGDPVEDAAPATASIAAQSPASLLTSIEECSFADLAIRQGVVASGWLPPGLFRNLAQQSSPFSSIHILWPILHRAPKHSPPFQTA
jgi:hypothetical protein